MSQFLGAECSGVTKIGNIGQASLKRAVSEWDRGMNLMQERYMTESSKVSICNEFGTKEVARFLHLQRRKYVAGFNEQWV